MDTDFEAMNEESNKINQIGGMDAKGGGINFVDEENKDRCGIRAQVFTVEGESGDAVQFQTTEVIAHL